MSVEHNNLDHQLAAVRSRWTRRDALLALSRTVLLMVPACLLLGWLDYRVEFSRAVRVIELAGLIALAGWTVRRVILPALTLRRDAYTAALQVESVYGQFGGRLVSRVEFTGSAGSGRPVPPGMSAVLIAAMCERIERDAADVPLGAAIDMQTCRRPAAIAAVALLVMSTVVIARPGLAARWLHRTALPLSEINWPKRTRISGLDPGYQVRRGDSVRITGLVGGERPGSGDIEWRPATRSGLRTRLAGEATFNVAADGSFIVTIGPLLEPVRFNLRIGDARIDDVPVEVVIPPELASIQAVYHYPAFTGRQPDRVQSGDVRALVGTRVDLTLEADCPTARIDLVFGGKTGRPPVNLTPPAQGQCSFVVGAKDRYEVRLFDANGFASDSPATFVVEPIDNELPTVRITRPGAEHTVTQATQLQVRFEAADDFGVTGAAIRWRKVRAEDTQPASQAAPGLVPIPLALPRKVWEGRFSWDLAAADLQNGDQVEYDLEVRDAGEHLSGEKAGISAKGVLKVVDPETLRLMVESRLREALAELEDIGRQQQTGREAVDVAIVSQPKTDEPIMPVDLRRLQTEESRQTRINRQADRLGDRLNQIADDLGDSFLADKDRVEGLRAMADGLRQLSGAAMTQAVEYLKRAREAMSESLSAPAATQRAN